MVESLNYCIELHNPNNAERKVLEILMRSVDLEEEDWESGVVEMNLIELAKEAGVSPWELIRALFFWQSVALISIDVGREYADDIIVFCQPSTFIEATKIWEEYNDCSDTVDGPSWKQGFLFMDLGSGITFYRP